MPFIIPSLKFDYKPVLELRARFERRVDRDFSEPRDDNKSDLFSRLRVGSTFKLGKTLSGQFVYQYAHDETWTIPENFATWRSDFLLANASYKYKEGAVTFGRQRVKAGSERLIGAADWNNISFAYDGVSGTYKDFGAFVVKSGLQPTPNNDLALYGVTYKEKIGQALLVFKHDTDNTEVNEFTLDQNIRYKTGNFSLDADFAGQVGHRDGKKKLAGAFDAVAGYSFTKQLGFILQGSVASGGGNGDTTNTFDQLYPAGHDRHGLTDMTGWRNVRDLGLGIKYQPDKETTFKFEYHRLGLDSNRDAWYSSNGKANSGDNGKFVDATGASGRDLGQEFDLDFNRKLNVHQSVQAGIGLFQPGGFVQKIDLGRTRQQVWGYVQWGYKF